MTLCYLNNINCCYYPAHTSHGLQPLDNGPYNSLKAAYRKHLARLSQLTDSAPVDKINFIRCYAAARVDSLTKKNIESGFRVTGNWPINRIKALSHPEIKPDIEDRRDRPPTPRSSPPAEGEGIPPDTPTTSRQIKDLGKYEAPSVRRKFQKAAKAYDAISMELVLREERIRELEAQLERVQPRKRRKIPNPNRTFMTLSECLARGLELTFEDVEEILAQENEAIQNDPGGGSEDGEELDEPEDELEGAIPEPVRTRSGRAIQRPGRYNN